MAWRLKRRPSGRKATNVALQRPFCGQTSRITLYMLIPTVRTPHVFTTKGITETSTETPTSVERAAREVWRANGAARSGRRSVKMRRSHRWLRHLQRAKRALTVTGAEVVRPHQRQVCSIVELRYVASGNASG